MKRISASRMAGSHLRAEAIPHIPALWLYLPLLAPRNRARPLFIKSGFNSTVTLSYQRLPQVLFQMSSSGSRYWLGPGGEGPYIYRHDYEKRIWGGRAFLVEM